MHSNKKTETWNIAVSDEGINQYNAFQTSLICLLQIGTVLVYLLAWRFFMGTKTKEATTTEETKEQVEVEEEAEEAKDQDQEDEKTRRLDGDPADAQVY